MASDNRDVTGLSESPTGRWHRTVSDIRVGDETVAHQTVDYRPDGSVESREIQHCQPCHCWE